MEIVKDISIKIYEAIKKIFSFVFSGDIGVHFVIHFLLGIGIMFVANYLLNYGGRGESNQKFAEAIGQGELYKVMPYIMTFCYPFAALVWRQTIGRIIPAGISVSGYGDTFIMVSIFLLIIKILYWIFYTLLLWAISPFIFPFGLLLLIIMRWRDFDLA
ncbi:hypothetical protein G7059_05255 [Erysipelothrix sp. HDW6A]|uniref:hypothetical protein n=1 Tax=Erysipelothrix sp. HDW6A TaxID=2714928 RepID=UPI0014080982|nr:hypothetical protein [Erysipelothrix sp. HDW6A]QIK57290.1 hypothetical protein G7059_05255 [Erysipelothrix sp. HDW6A]